MGYRLPGLIIGIIFGLTTAGLAVAQAPKSSSAGKTWVQPTTPWGDPDLQGTWTGDDCIGTPMNPPANFGPRPYYTEQELADKEKQIEKQHENDLVDTVAS